MDEVRITSTGCIEGRGGRPRRIAVEEMWFERLSVGSPPVLRAILDERTAQIDLIQAEIGSPGGQSLGWIEFRLVGVIKGQAVYEATALHPASEPAPSSEDLAWLIPASSLVTL